MSTGYGLTRVAALGVMTAAGLVLLSQSRSAVPNTGSAGTAPVVAQGSIARQSVSEHGIRFSFRVPAGWERFSSLPSRTNPKGPISLNKSAMGPQGAEAIVYWTSYPDGDHADACDRVLGPQVGRSAAALAAAVSTARGTRLVGGPANVTLGGHPAKHVELIVLKDVGCDPGYFYTWRDVYRGALWPITSVGDRIKVWIVTVRGTRLFIAAVSAKYGGGLLAEEVQEIIESIRFR